MSVWLQLVHSPCWTVYPHGPKPCERQAAWVPFTLTLESGWGGEEDFFGSRRPEPWSCSLVGPLEAAGGPIGPQAPGN